MSQKWIVQIPITGYVRDMVTLERTSRNAERLRWQQDVDALTIQIEKLKDQK